MSLLLLKTAFEKNTILWFDFVKVNISKTHKKSPKIIYTKMLKNLD